MPKIPSYRILDVAEAIAPTAKTEIVGIRPGEKLHEEMITASDSFMTVDVGEYYVILPQTHRFSVEEYCQQVEATRVAEGFTYNSGTNTEWLSVEQIRDLIKQHVDADFEV